MNILPMALPTPAPRTLPLYLRTSEPVTFATGFYAPESAGGSLPFHWMQLHGALTFEASSDARFLELVVLSEFLDCSQALTIEGQPPLALPPGVSTLSIEIPPGASTAALSVNKAFPGEHHPTDHRTLAIRIEQARLHVDVQRHEHVAHQHSNAVQNVREMMDGTALLASTPRSLGIDLYGSCNVKPACVYCEWDWNKTLEGEFVDTPFTLDTLKEWGPFFDNSASLVNCSIGEPFMMKNIDELLDAFGDSGKVLDMTSNGQILTDRNIQKLLGRKIDLYVSLDAATAETYAKLRNNRFDVLVANLKRLIDAKGGPGHLPRVYLVFMPMTANEHELDQFIQLCADLRADQLVLRPLNFSDHLELDTDRAGYKFRYQHELLPFDKLVWISGRAAELCRRLGVELSDQMDFGGSMSATFQRRFEEGQASLGPEVRHDAAADAAVPVAHALEAPPVAEPQPPPTTAAALPSLGAEHTPACTEPWKSLYILRRGVFPCCYGGVPVAPMDQYREAWNSPLVQDIRRDLSQDRFHKYCLESPACPIVRKHHRAGQLPLKESFKLWLKAAGHRAERVYRKPLARVVFVTQWSMIRAKRIVTDPAYVRMHVAKAARRIIGR